MTAWVAPLWLVLVTGLGAGELSAHTQLKAADALQADRWLRMAAGICPQNRKTRRAPKRYLKKNNPLTDSSENRERGRVLYNKDAKPTACRLCHGVRGTGNGKLAMPLDPPPRNFTCAENMRGVSDGQLFWIIKKGSKGTAMPAHERTLSDREIWELILYIRRFVR